MHLRGLSNFVCVSGDFISGRSELSFYTVPEYNVWKEGHANGKGWNAKYYKVTTSYRFTTP